MRRQRDSLAAEKRLITIMNLKLSVIESSVKDIEPWRDLYRQEMKCQIIHDSLHARAGWTRPYLLQIGNSKAGYGSIVVGGPWAGNPTVFEFYLLPEHRTRVFDLFGSLLTVSKAVRIETQTNDVLLSIMLFAWGQNIQSEKIIFEDKATTTHPPAQGVFRRKTAEDTPRIFAHQYEPVGDWILEAGDAIVATGGILFHYNRPYGDIFMEVAEPFRRRGFGTYIVQELKKVCYGLGSIPCARCNTASIASRKTCQKAGLVPCAHILRGSLAPRESSAQAFIG
jgi:GNAT superfamily N-acetyltransferase